ncbi:vWA domain-containing protein [Yersinia enterocolitica]|uniref:TadE/TadG family protein n=2 Tax=Yersinia enterocolitica TaxID=630 RepID=UPI00398CF5AA
MTNTDIIRKLNRLTQFKKNEHGAILVSFIIIFPFFIALTFIIFEVSIFLQKKAKLSDAIEQATLALTVENDSHNPDKIQIARNTALVTSYADAYLPSKTFSTPEIEIIKHFTHLEYRATTTLIYSPQFLTKSPITNTDKNIHITDKAIARKNIFVEPTEKTDVVFVVDYSSSMNEAFSKEEPLRKSEVLSRIFKSLHDTILKNNNIKTTGFIPFAWGTKMRVETKEGIKEYCHFPYTPSNYRPDGDYLRRYTPLQLTALLHINRLDDLDKIDKLYNPDQIQLKALTYDNFIMIKKRLYALYKIQGEPISSKSYVKDDRENGNVVIERLNNTFYMKNPFYIMDKIIENIDFTKTINSIKNGSNTIDIPMSDMPYSSYCFNNSTTHSLNLEDKANNSLSDIGAFEPGGFTLISSGILAGNRLLNEPGNTNNKLMVILSDGNDTDTSTGTATATATANKINISKKLIENEMCDKIKENNIRMVFIGIKYVPTGIDWKECVGEGNYYEAYNAHELEADLRQALGTTEIREVGRNTPKD